MNLEGIHHITAITADAPRNVDFYTRVLGLRMVKKTVNQDDPTIYHLFYGDEEGHPGLDLTFFEYPGVGRGRPGAGMVHRIVWRVGSEEALDFWERRLSDEGTAVAREDGRLRFDDPEGLSHELGVSTVDDQPLIAEHAEVPPDMALQGFDGVQAYSAEPSGVLFEIATIGPGFTVDEPAEHLGEKLSLPPDYEHLRERVEPLLTPLPNLRELVKR